MHPSSPVKGTEQFWRFKRGKQVSEKFSIEGLHTQYEKRALSDTIPVQCVDWPPDQWIFKEEFLKRHPVTSTPTPGSARESRSKDGQPAAGNSAHLQLSAQRLTVPGALANGTGATREPLRKPATISKGQCPGPLCTSFAVPALGSTSSVTRNPSTVIKREPQHHLPNERSQKAHKTSATGAVPATETVQHQVTRRRPPVQPPGIPADAKHEYFLTQHGDSVWWFPEHSLSTQGNVFRGLWQKHSLRSCEDVAVKQVLMNRLQDGLENNLTSLQSKNVVKYHLPAQLASPCAYIVMERCEGSLTAHLKEKRTTSRLSWGEAIGHCRQICEGIKDIHSIGKRGWVHGDIKPDNILYSHEDGKLVLKICDFGTSREVEQTPSTPEVAGGGGSTGFRAAELGTAMLWPQDNTGECRRSADVFSLGCVWYYIVSHTFGDGILVFTQGKNQFSEQGAITDRKMARGLTDDQLLRDVIKGNTGAPEYSVLMLSKLLSRMISHDSRKRPTAIEVLASPLFWDPPRVVLFMHVVTSLLSPGDRPHFSQSLNNKLAKLRAELQEEERVQLKKTGRDWVECVLEFVKDKKCLRREDDWPERCNPRTYAKNSKRTTFQYVQWARNIITHRREHPGATESRFNQPEIQTLENVLLCVRWVPEWLYNKVDSSELQFVVNQQGLSAGISEFFPASMPCDMQE
ncbi:hypothetical protein CYMTET_4741 [Cymbomonas tetramitiformis]|uniref:Protein kinase domain-containing protein n=1 Tax=Cymbomonas tetramitiformis TaxID=36881 RepID=A0AAE0LJS7_9CHLO|nr:hypothetical protein CYMTET_4741 [Cymbomonas tetramitiformis]